MLVSALQAALKWLPVLHGHIQAHLTMNVFVELYTPDDTTSVVLEKRQTSL